MKNFFLVLILFLLVSCSYAKDAVTGASPVREPAHEAGAGGSALTAQEATQIVALHNQARAVVGVGELVWSGELAAYAQEWADNLSKSGCRFKHRPDNSYGENIYKGMAGDSAVSDAPKAWESEKKYYHGQALNNANWAASGHYTQMVWKNTKQIGCGKVECDGDAIVVCNYDPAGNMLGQKPY